MKIRRVNLNDSNEWARMRNLLWNSSKEEHLEEIDQYLANNSTKIVNVLVLEKNNGKLGGFIELNIRNYAEGSELEAVPYIEGWYIDSDIRNNGYGKQLIAMAESIVSIANILNQTCILAKLWKNGNRSSQFHLD